MKLSVRTKVIFGSEHGNFLKKQSALYFLASPALMFCKFKVGDKKTYHKTVKPEDIAVFHGEAVHEVYATFAIARDAEWAGRLFVLEMKEANEEGIGTFVNVEHYAPAFVGEEVVFAAEITELKGNAIHCFFSAKVGERLVARGHTGQKVIVKEKLNQLFDSYK